MAQQISYFTTYIHLVRNRAYYATANRALMRRGYPINVDQVALECSGRTVMTICAVAAWDAPPLRDVRNAHHTLVITVTSLPVLSEPTKPLVDLDKTGELRHLDSCVLGLKRVIQNNNPPIGPRDADRCHCISVTAPYSAAVNCPSVPATKILRLN